MANAGLQAPDIPAPHPFQLSLILHSKCNNLHNLTLQRQQIHIHWSHFKPEFSGKPKEDAEAHLLRTND